MKKHYRCSKCEMRHVFQHAPESYLRPKKCRQCKSDVFRVDKWMMGRDTHAAGCMCAGYPEMTAKNAPHRKGSLYCWYRKDGTQRYEGDSDFKDRYLEDLALQINS